MKPNWKWPWQRGSVFFLFVLYLLLCDLYPAHWYTPLLGLAVVIAARWWEVRGGVLAALFAGLALGFGLWRMDAMDVPAHHIVLTGYFWAWVAILSMGVGMGSLTRHARALVRANRELRQAQERLTALHTIARSLSTTLDPNALINLIIEQLAKLWGYDLVSVLLVDERTNELVVAAAHGYVKGPGHRIPADQGICGAVVRSAQPECVEDVTRDPRYILGVEGALSELAVPLLWEGQVLGVLNVESRVPNAYGAGDIALLATVAEQAAACLGNASLYQKTQQLVITDPHTDLYNYRHFREQVTAAVRDAQLTGAQCSLIMIDLDHFKRCNDTYGHPTGDAVLQQVARLLRESCRQQDLVFRYGGEEFSVLLPGSGREAAIRVADRIRERVATHLFTTSSGRRLDMVLTVSLGVASYPQDSLSAVDLLLAADRALYAAKSEGRNRVHAAHGAPHAEPA